MKREMDDWEDATENLFFWIVPTDVRHCKPRDPDNCAGALGIEGTVPNVLKARLFLEYTYVWFKGKKLPTRYKNTPEVRRLAELNDIGPRMSIYAAYKAEFKNNGGRSFPFKLIPIPAGSVRSKEYLRSKEMQEMRRLSQERRNENIRKGIPPRKYTSPKAKGLRSGIGLAHSWEVR